MADVVVVNTCSVTAEADRAARAYIRRAHRLNPEARIVVTGCYAQRAPEELAGLDGVAAVVGNSHKALAPQIAVDLARRVHYRRSGRLAVWFRLRLLLRARRSGLTIDLRTRFSKKLRWCRARRRGPISRFRKGAAIAVRSA